MVDYGDTWLTCNLFPCLRHRRSGLEGHVAFAEARYFIELLGKAAKRAFVSGLPLEQRLAASEQQLAAAVAEVLALKQELAETKAGLGGISCSYCKTLGGSD